MYVVHVCEIEDISDTILGDTENPVELYIDSIRIFVKYKNNYKMINRMEIEYENTFS